MNNCFISCLTIDFVVVVPVVDGDGGCSILSWLLLLSLLSLLLLLISVVKDDDFESVSGC